MIPPPLIETLEWLLKIEDFPTVRSLAHTVFRQMPEGDPRATDFLAQNLFRAKYYVEAATVAQDTLTLIPDSVDAQFNAAKCLNSAGRPVDAERLMRAVTVARPDWIDPQIDLAVYIAAQGRLDEAMTMLLDIQARLPASDPNADVVKFNLGWHFLRHERFRDGINALGIGRKLRIWGAMTHRHARPRLETGMNMRGRRILLCGEGGAGDEIINARFGSIIKERGGHPIWMSQAPLQSLLKRTHGLDDVLTLSALPPDSYDYWAPCMDLPRILGLDLHEIPRGPYITAEPSHINKWATRVKDRQRLKVGLRWQGNALYEQDLMRSVPFKLLEGLLDIPGVDFYSLQRDEGAEERPVDSTVVDWGSQLATWDDTAGAIANLDLVISSCTSVPHLAAAMGKPTWIFCPINCYYIWATPGDRSPWYTDATLYRQTQFGSWDEPFARIRAQLQETARTHTAGMNA